MIDMEKLRIFNLSPHSDDELFTSLGIREKFLMRLKLQLRND